MMGSAKTATPPPSWSDLQQELLAHIYKFLQSDVDVLRCSLVCVSWRSAAINARRRFSPFLLIHRKHEPSSVGLMDLSTQDSHGIHLPEGRYWLCGSTHGWVLTVGIDLPHKMRLLNPISRTQIPLPPIDHEFVQSIQDYVKKSVISTDPFHPDCMVLLIYQYGHKLGFCRPGDTGWTALDSSELGYIDLMFYEDKFYAADKKGNILRCELGGSNPRVVLIATSADSNYSEKFLVGSSSGDFWLVARVSRCKVLFDDSDEDDDEDFKVYRLDLGTREWSKVENLGSDALFLGHIGPASVSSSSEKSGRNRVYCISCCFGGWSETVVYDLETKRTEKIHESTDSVFWIVPKLV